MPRIPVSLFGLICCVLLLAPAAFAQDTLTFRIDSYIPEHFTDFEWRLDGGLNFGGMTSTSEFTSSDASDYMDQGGATNNQSLNTETYLNYRHETLARIILASMRLQGSFANQNRKTSLYDMSYFELDRTKSSDEDTRSNDFSWSPAVTGRQYLRGDVFAEFTASGLIDYSGTSHREENTTENNYVYDSTIRTTIMQTHTRSRRPRDGKRYRVDVSLRPGWGRITEGQFAAISLYIIEELTTRGLITSQPTDAEMWQLTDLIYREITTHAVDDRLSKIDALLHVMEFLEDNGIASDAGPLGYVLIQDIWDYYPHQRRPFGFLCGTGFGYEYSYLTRQTTQDQSRRYDYITYWSDPAIPADTVIGTTITNNNYTHYSSSQKKPYAVITASWHEPVSLRWQLDADMEAKYYINAENSNEDVQRTYSYGYIASDRLLIQRIEYDANYRIQTQAGARYIFDSRTSASLTASYLLTHYNSTETGELIDRRIHMTFVNGPQRRDYREDRLSVNGGLTYRISIPTTLRVNMSYQYSDIDRFEDLDASYANGHFGLSASISHYLF